MALDSFRGLWYDNHPSVLTIIIINHCKVATKPFFLLQPSHVKRQLSLVVVVVIKSV